MIRIGQLAIVTIFSLALAGCSGKPDPVAENEKQNEPKKTDNKPAKKVDVAKEQKPAAKPSGNAVNKKPDDKKTDNKKPDTKKPDTAKPAAGGKGKTTEDQLLVIINKGIAENRFDYSLDEQLEKRHKEFLPILLKMAADNSMAVPQRAAAIMAIEDLLLIGNDKEKADRKKKVVSVLVPILRDKSNHAGVRAAAATILSDRDEYPESVEAWEAGVLQTESAMAQIYSVIFLPDASKIKMLPQLIPLMRSPNPELAKFTILGIWLLKKPADPAIPEFVELLKNPKHPEIDGLLTGLGAIGTRPELTLPVLKSYAEKPDSHGYSIAARSLTEVLAKNDLDPAPYFPTLKLSLERCSESQRENTLESLETLGPKAAPLIPIVLPYLDDKNEGVQTQAISVLKALGPAGKPAAEELKKRLAAPDAKHREELLEALRAIVPDDPSLPKD